MKSALFSLLALLFATACSQKETEQEPDYENMVMAEEEDGITDEERDRKVIAGDLPDPQERILIEPSEMTQ